jgi:hypothetical protein
LSVTTNETLLNKLIRIRAADRAESISELTLVLKALVGSEAPAGLIVPREATPKTKAAFALLRLRNMIQQHAHPAEINAHYDEALKAARAFDAIAL